MLGNKILMSLYVLSLCILYGAAGASIGLVVAFFYKAITGDFPRELVPALAVVGAGTLPVYAGYSRLRAWLYWQLVRKD